MKAGRPAGERADRRRHDRLADPDISGLRMCSLQAFSEHSMTGRFVETPQCSLPWHLAPSRLISCDAPHLSCDDCRRHHRRLCAVSRAVGARLCLPRE